MSVPGFFPMKNDYLDADKFWGQKYICVELLFISVHWFQSQDESFIGSQEYRKLLKSKYK